MRSFFRSIRKADLLSVREQLVAAPALLSSTCEPPAKKDAGQSPLQVSLKAQAFDVSDLMIEAGADVNFMESEIGSEWRAPVLHDAITACFFSTDVERALMILRKILERGPTPTVGTATATAPSIERYSTSSSFPQ